MVPTFIKLALTRVLKTMRQNRAGACQQNRENQMAHEGDQYANSCALQFRLPYLRRGNVLLFSLFEKKRAIHRF